MTLFRLFAPLVAVFSTTAAFAQDNSLGILTLAQSHGSRSIAVEVHLRVRVAKPMPGHEYRLKYQFRLHTRPGTLGPVLGNAANPDGVVFDAGPLVKPTGAGWLFDTHSAPGVGPDALEEAAKTLEFNGTVDVARKDLSGMTNLPKNSQNAIVRVEPLLYDATDRRFVTPPKTNAVLLFLETGRAVEHPGGEFLESLARQVWVVRTFQDWFPLQFDTEENARAAIRLVDEVEAWDRYHEVIAGFERVLTNSGVKPALKVLVIRAIPAPLMNEKLGFVSNTLPRLLATLARSDDADLKAAALASSLKPIGGNSGLQWNRVGMQISIGLSPREAVIISV